MSTDINKVLIGRNGWTSDVHHQVFKTNKKRYRIVLDGSLCVTYEVQLKKRFLFLTWWTGAVRNGYIANFMSLNDAIKWVEDGAKKTTVLWQSAKGG